MSVPNLSSGGHESKRSRRRASADEKLEAVLRVLRGDDRETVARDLEVSVDRLARWESTFMGGGRAALAQTTQDAHHHHRRKISGAAIGAVAGLLLALVLSAVLISRFLNGTP